VTIWADRAADASRVLVDAYWDERRGLFRNVPARRLPTRVGAWNYWWQAHALDSLVLAAAATDAGAAADADADRANKLVAGVLRRNGGHITNDYHDDMAWMGLALHEAAVAGLVVAGTLVEELMAALRAGLDREHGAIVWRRGDTYLNVAANAPTAILAARTADHALAQRLTAWLHATLVCPDGAVYDGLHPGGRPDTTTWTYNYGTVIGADVALGELGRARRIAATAAVRLPGADGVLPDEGSGDRSLFKGVFVRHLGALVLATPDTPLRDLLVRNAEAAWASRSPEGLIGPDWTRRPDRPVELSAHLSGVLLLQTVSAISTPPHPIQHRPAT
jgi:predicted alpha-1,6-mannanase (GH76 family)